MSGALSGKDVRMIFRERSLGGDQAIVKAREYLLVKSLEEGRLRKRVEVERQNC